MGSPCRLVVDGGPDELVTNAHELIADLERRWSRFRPDSEISRLNRDAGDLSIVSPRDLRAGLPSGRGPGTHRWDGSTR